MWLWQSILPFCVHSECELRWYQVQSQLILTRYNTKRGTCLFDIGNGHAHPTIRLSSIQLLPWFAFLKLGIAWAEAHLLHLSCPQPILQTQYGILHCRPGGNLWSWLRRAHSSRSMQTGQRQLSLVHGWLYPFLRVSALLYKVGSHFMHPHPGVWPSAPCCRAWVETEARVVCSRIGRLGAGLGCVWGVVVACRCSLGRLKDWVDFSLLP